MSGRDGKVFDLYKFRSMRLITDELDDDGRVIRLEFLLGGDTAPGGVEGADRRTPVGRFMRRSRSTSCHSC